MSRAAWLLALGSLAWGCVPPTIDLRGRACPCGTGWVCMDDVCVPEGTARADGGATDGGADAGAPVDASVPVDAAVGMDAAVGSDAGLDAGGADAGGTDAGSDAGTPDSGAGETGCDGPLAGAILCDGFESSPGPWTLRAERTGSATRTTTRAQVGAYSFDSVTTAINGQASLGARGLGPYTDADLWMRVSLYVPSAAAVDDFTFLYVGEDVSPFHGVSLGMGSDGRAGAYSTISANYVSSFDALLVPRDRWVCFEVHVAVASSGGAIEVFMDGTLRAGMTGLDTLPGAGFTIAYSGIDYTGPAQGPLEVFLDEYALSRTRLACP
ncbi:MAG: hypothetical protein H6719_34495 [Sandaracinaceae bacterium]|nr:hypothetical protein [Sandaracinaceae bacterium]